MAWYKAKKSSPEYNGYRSGFEEQVAEMLDKNGIKYEFESMKIKYEQPSRIRTYTPDFILPNNIIIETKGRFLTADRQKHLLIKEQYPDLDIRFIFWNPNQTISKQSNTTYAMWCDRHGFKWASRTIPKDWLQEVKKKERKGS